jgi:type I restriction enzyme S subunit
MTARLPDHLDLIAAAPAGIQKLRGLILELAVRGKLVPQDPSEEPASELLKRIAQERARLEAAGICKKSKPTSVVADEWPFDLSEGWKWCRLPDVASYRCYVCLSQRAEVHAHPANGEGLRSSRF